MNAGSGPSDLGTVRVPLEVVIALGGVYCLATAILIWSFGIRAFLRKYWEKPSPNVWGPALFEDYVRARAVVQRLGWKPFYVLGFEVLFVLGWGCLIAAAVLRWA